MNSAGDGTAAGPVTATPVAPPPSVSIAAVYPKATMRLANPEFRVTIAEAQTSAVTVNLSIAQDASYLASTTQSIEIAARDLGDREVLGLLCRHHERGPDGDGGRGHRLRAGGDASQRGDGGGGVAGNYRGTQLLLGRGRLQRNCRATPRRSW